MSIFKKIRITTNLMLTKIYSELVYKNGPIALMLSPRTKIHDIDP